jgi:hypothetical protein
VNSAAPVHPFPARMAPQLALDRLPDPTDEKLRILDPMMGSGTIPVLAAMQGHRAVGFDVDPLALLIARTWGRAIDEDDLRSAAERVIEKAEGARAGSYEMADEETQEFVDYWFDQDAQAALHGLALAIKDEEAALQDGLWCAFSRLIITKDAGASLARDVSHSRPHRVRTTASFDPIERFSGAVSTVITRHSKAGQARPPESKLRLDTGDARELPLNKNSVDVVLTSPPYLQAIDYLRGHRLALVWMDHTLSELRETRGSSIGSERGLNEADEIPKLRKRFDDLGLSPRAKRILNRYIADLGHVARECTRVLRPSGSATFVVADATLEGRRIRIAEIVTALMKENGLTLKSQFTRPIRTDRRYLPPPSAAKGQLDRRMREEQCLTYA